MTVYIGYDNRIPNGTVSVTSEAADYPKENAYDWILSDWWKAAAAGTVYFTIDAGSAVDWDSWGIAGHDLHDNSGTIKPQYSSDNFSVDINDFDTVQTPTDGDPIFRKVTSRNAQYFRFEINSTSFASVIGMLFAGQALALLDDIRGKFTPPRMARNNTLYSNKTDGGAFIGRSVIREGFRFNLSQDFLTRSWMDSNWDSLIDHLETKPCFLSWNYENYPLDAIFCWLKSNTAPVPSYKNPLFIGVTFNFEGV